MTISVYVETTIPSYLAAWPSRDLITAAQQQITYEWWKRRARFTLYISELVLREASGGDSQAAGRRLEVIEGIPVLALTDNAQQLASRLLADGGLPSKALGDALHIGIAAYHGIEYMVTWNCTHLANALLRPTIEQICRANGVIPPIICTPAELLEGGDDVA